MSDAQAIAYAVRVPDGLKRLKSKGLSEEHLSQEYKPIWRFINRCQDKHGKLPSRTLIESRYDWVSVPEVEPDDLEHIVEDLNKRRRYNVLLSGIEEVVRDVRTPDDWEKGVTKLKYVLDRSMGLATNGHTHDPFASETVRRMVKEAQIRRKQKNIKIGLPSIDLVTGGLQQGRLVIVAGRPGAGKALAIDTPILTTQGWSTMGDLKIGDRVFGMDGRPCTVTATTEVMTDRPCYDIHFSDKSIITADEQHEWLTYDHPARKSMTEGRRGDRARKSGRTPYNDQRHKRIQPQIRTTKQISESLIGPGGRKNHSIPLAAPLRYRKRKLPIDPYVLGLYLGDGSKNDGGITASIQDVGELTSLIEACGESVHLGVNSGGHKIIRIGKPDPLACQYGHPGPRSEGGDCLECRKMNYEFSAHGVPRPPKTNLALATRLRKLGVLPTKHVPRIYLEGSYEQRLALLQGLMDSDGWAGGYCEFSNTNRALAQAAYDLAIGLGFRATMSEGRAMLYGKDCGTKYRVNFSADTPVFRLTRKVLRQKVSDGYDNARRKHRYIVDIKPRESVPVRCIQVDSPDHMYLAGRSCVPTHNSMVAVWALAQAIRQGRKVLMYSLEMSEYEVLGRLYTVLSRQRMGPEGTLRNMDFHTGALKARKLFGTIKELSPHYKGKFLLSDFSVNASLEQIDADIENYQPDMVWIDYLTLMPRPRSGGDAAWETVGALSGGLKKIALRRNIVMGACAQLNRVATQTKTPGVEHLAQSDAVGQDADVVIFVAGGKGTVKMSVEKNRCGPRLNPITVLFAPDEGLLEEIDDGIEDE